MYWSVVFFKAKSTLFCENLIIKTRRKILSLPDWSDVPDVQLSQPRCKPHCREWPGPVADKAKIRLNWFALLMKTKNIFTLKILFLETLLISVSRTSISKRHVKKRFENWRRKCFTLIYFENNGTFTNFLSNSAVLMNPSNLPTIIILFWRNTTTDRKG